jgi:hypothetical protein
MPYLPDNTEKLERVFLPSTEHLPDDEKAWVVMDVSPLLAGDAGNVGQDAETGADASLYMLTARIREWNFTERDGSPSDISLDNIKRLHLADLGHLQNKIEVGEGALTDEEKKASSEPSLPPETGVNIQVKSL